jgi:dephospho-CoA kinase
MPVEEKLKHATERIDCSGTMEETRAQVERLAERLRKA